MIRHCWNTPRNYFFLSVPPPPLPFANSSADQSCKPALRGKGEQLGNINSRTHRELYTCLLYFLIPGQTSGTIPMLSLLLQCLLSHHQLNGVSVVSIQHQCLHLGWMEKPYQLHRGTCVTTLQDLKNSSLSKGHPLGVS